MSARAPLFTFHCDGIRWALRAALEAAAAEGCRTVLVARIAGGLYAGRHARDVQSAYRHIVDEVLCEEMGSTTVPRGRFFEEVTIVDLGTGWRPAR